MQRNLDFSINFNKYKGSSIFLTLSGPSVTSSVVRRLSKPYLMKAGVNNSPKTIRPNLWVCVDPPDHFLGSVWKDPSIEKYVPNVYLSRYYNDCATSKYSKKHLKELPNIYGYDFTTSFYPEKLLSNKEVFWGTGSFKALGSSKNTIDSVSRNVAPATIDILIKLGFKNIYLVGADGFRLPKRLHSYKIKQKMPLATYDGCLYVYSFLNTYFDVLKKSLPELGVNIYNCSKSSIYTEIPYISLSKAIKNVEKELGNPDSETINIFKDPSGVTNSSPEVAILHSSEHKAAFDLMDNTLESILNGDFKLPEAVNAKYSEYNM